MDNGSAEGLNIVDATAMAVAAQCVTVSAMRQQLLLPAIITRRVLASPAPTTRSWQLPGRKRYRGFTASDPRGAGPLWLGGRSLKSVSFQVPNL